MVAMMAHGGARFSRSCTGQKRGVHLRRSAHRRTLSRPFARRAALDRRCPRARSRLRAAGPRGRRRLRALRFRARAPGAARADGVHSGGVGRKCVPDRRCSTTQRPLGAAIRAAWTKRVSHLLVSAHAGAPAAQARWGCLRNCRKLSRLSAAWMKKTRVRRGGWERGSALRDAKKHRLHRAGPRGKR